MQDRHLRSFNFNACPVLHPIIFHDDCEGTFHWQAAGDGADYVAEYSNAHALVANKSIKLSTKSTDPTIADQVSATKSLWLTPHKVLNLTTAFARLADGAASLDHLLTWYDETNSHAAGIRVNRTNATGQYMNSGATWTTIAGVTWNYAKTPVWNKLRLSIDLETNKYISLALNHQLTDLSAISFAVSADAAIQRLALSLVVTAAHASVCTFHIDQLLLRGDNP